MSPEQRAAIDAIMEYVHEYSERRIDEAVATEDGDTLRSVRASTSATHLHGEIEAMIEALVYSAAVKP